MIEGWIKEQVEFIKYLHFRKFFRNFTMFTIFVLFIFYIIFPAVMSTWYDNSNLGVINVTTANKYGIGGRFHADGTIEIFQNSTIVLRHELCHKDLWKKKTNTFLEESWCYVQEYNIFRKVNLTTLDYEK